MWRRIVALTPTRGMGINVLQGQMPARQMIGEQIDLNPQQTYADLLGVGCMLPNLVKYYIKIHYNNRFASPRHNSGSPPNDQVVPREILSHEPSTLLSHRAFSVLLTSSLSEDKFIRVDSGNILLNQLRTKHEA